MALRCCQNVGFFYCKFLPVYVYLNHCSFTKYQQVGQCSIQYAAVAFDFEHLLCIENN